jgi:putative FmdB family regulatory protein
LPKYDYRCTACGHVYEKREGFDAPAVQTCPRCEGQARRVLTAPAIVFKGSGWYITDSRKPEPATEDGKSEKGEAKSGSSVSESVAAD